MNIVIPSLLGVESVISGELQDLGYDKSRITVKTDRCFWKLMTPEGTVGSDCPVESQLENR